MLARQVFVCSLFLLAAGIFRGGWFFFSWIFILYADRDLQGTGIVRRKLRETLKE